MLDRNITSNQNTNGDFEIHFTRLIHNDDISLNNNPVEEIGVFKNNYYLKIFFNDHIFTKNDSHIIDPRLLDTLKNFIATDMGDRLLKGLDISYLQGVYDGISYVRNKLHNDDTVYYHLFTD